MGFCCGNRAIIDYAEGALPRADLPGFKARLSAQFGVPLPQVEAVIAEVRTPGDAYMVMGVGQVAHQPQDVVLNEYQANKGKGRGYQHDKPEPLRSSATGTHLP